MAANRSVDDDVDGLAGAPWWWRVFVRVGAPTAFACILLWYLITNVTGSLSHLDAQANAQTANLQVILQNQGRIMESQETNEMVATRILRVLAAYCYNNAANQLERDRCTSALQ